MEEIGRGHRVVEGPMGRPVGESQMLGQRAQPAVGHLVAHQPAGETARVDRAVAEPRVARAPRGRRRGTTTSKRRLCPTSTAPRANSRNAGSTSSISGAGSTIVSVMPVR